MQCRRCGFENMPGLARCGRCQTVLMATAPVNVHPPRAKGSKRLRAAGYRLNRLLSCGVLAPVQEWGERVKAAMPGGDGEPLLFACISVIPGLGHLLTGRVRRIRWAWLAWCGAILLGLLLYGSWPGGVLIGGAVAAHAWIVCDAGNLRERATTTARRIALPVGVFFLLLLLPYAGVRSVAGWFVRGCLSPQDLTAAGVHARDFLLVWRRAYRTEGPQRGDLALWSFPPQTYPGYVIRGGEVFGLVVALPGDKIVVKAGEVSVVTPAGATYNWHTDGLLMDAVADIRLSDTQYFCIGPQPSVRTVVASSLFLDSVLRVPRGAFEGRAFMIWNPIWRRKWLGAISPIAEQGSNDEPIRQPGV